MPMKAVCFPRLLALPVVLTFACRGDDGNGGSGGSGTDSASTGATASAGTATSAGSGTAGSGSAGTTTATSSASGGTASSGSSGGTASSGSSGGTASSGGGSSSGGGMLDACGQAPGQLLGPQLPWNQKVDAAVLASDSDAVIAYLEANVQGGARFQIDFSFAILEADANTIKQSWVENNDFWSPDCDTAPVPIPANGHIEGETGYACENDGDCHLLVVHRDECRLYEHYRTNFLGMGAYDGGCLAIWDLQQAYDETLRGDYCTSADAAGLPIAPLLFTADEVAAGEIRHAIRFILPNEHVRADMYVRPGTHSTMATSGPMDAPPYSARLRLKADVDVSGLNPAAQVVAQALKTYGMIMADGGNVTFNANGDDFTTSTWAGVGLGPHDLKALQWTDFEVVDGGTPIAWSQGSCDRTPIMN